MNLTVTRSEFYLDSRKQAHFRLLAGEHGSRRVEWDFPLDTPAMDGEIPEPKFVTQKLYGLVDNPSSTSVFFLVLFNFGKLDAQKFSDVTPEKYFSLADAWHAKCYDYLKGIEREKIAKEIQEYAASGDMPDAIELPAEEDITQLKLICTYVTHNSRPEQWGLMLTQLNGDDTIRDVWQRTDLLGGQWLATTVRGKKTVPEFLHVHGGGAGWQKLLDTLTEWALNHGKRPFAFHVENDGTFLAAEDSDPRHTFEFDLDGEEGDCDET